MKNKDKILPFCSCLAIFFFIFGGLAIIDTGVALAILAVITAIYELVIKNFFSRGLENLINQWTFFPKSTHLGILLLFIASFIGFIIFTLRGYGVEIKLIKRSKNINL